MVVEKTDFEKYSWNQSGWTWSWCEKVVPVTTQLFVNLLTSWQTTSWKKNQIWRRDGVRPQRPNVVHTLVVTNVLTSNLTKRTAQLSACLDADFFLKKLRAIENLSGRFTQRNLDVRKRRTNQKKKQQVAADKIGI